MRHFIAVCLLIPLAAVVLAADDKKEEKKVEIIIPKNMLSAYKPEKLKKGIDLKIEITDDKVEGFKQEDTMKKVTKVDGEAPKEGKIYTYFAVIEVAGVKNDHTIIVCFDKKMKVATKLKDVKLVAEFKADTTGQQQGSYYLCEATLDEK
jgi:hypothetical protein